MSTSSQGYGGNIIAMFTEEDEELVRRLRHKESIVRSTAMPSLWVIQRPAVREALLSLYKILQFATFRLFTASLLQAMRSTGYA